MNYYLRKAYKPVFRTAVRLIRLPDSTFIEGFGVREQAGDICKKNDYKKVLIVTDKTLIKFGYLQKLTDRLEQNNIQYAIYDGITPDPTFSVVNEAKEIGLNVDAECVIALGGGSVMDAAKMAAAALKNPKASIEQLMVLFIGTRKGALPIITIPTTAGTGSEISIGAVISDDITHEKQAAGGLPLLPRDAILDTELMMKLPAAITAATGFDALCHGIECYLSIGKLPKKHEGLDIESVKLIMKNLPIAYNDGSNKSARKAMSRGAYYAGLALNYEVGALSHAFGHAFGGMYHYPHGVSCAVALPKVLRLQQKISEDKLANLAEACGYGNVNDSNAVLADKFISEVEKLMQLINIQTTIPELKAQDYPELVREIINNSMKGMDRYTLTNQDVLNILNQCSDGLTVSYKDAFNA